MKSVKLNWLAPLIVLIVVLIIWKAVLHLNLVPVYILPSPEMILGAFQEMNSEFMTATLTTLRSTLWGFVLSGVLGFAAAMLLASHRILKDAFLPFALFFQTVPVVSLAPLLVIWFGFGEPTVRVSSFIVAFFPVLANSLMGLTQSSSDLEEVFKLYQASSMKKLRKLQIPASLPYLFVGLEISAGLSVIGSIVGEFMAGGGLGGLIDSARTQQRIDIVFGAILLSSALGILMVSAVRLTAKVLNSQRPYFKT